MTQLSCFSDEDIKTIISLPYRVGINVSYADDEDGERDDEAEMRALEACISEVAKLQEGEGLVKEVATKVLDSKDDWDSWSQGVFNIEPLCEKAVLALKTHASDDEIRSYIKMIVEIATTVAQAYGEFGEEIEPDKGFFAKAANKIASRFAGLSGDDANHPMNVSASESDAISSIIAALKKNI